MNNDKKQSWDVAMGVGMRRAGGWAVLKSAGLWCLLLALGSLPAPAQQIKTVAGGGPNNLAPTEASLNTPMAIVQDSSGNFYIAARGDNRVYKVDAAGTLTVFAGNGSAGFSGDGGAATSAALNQPFDVFVDAVGNIFIADTFNHRIRKVDAATGNIQTVAGNGTAGFSGDGGAATSAELNNPEGVFVDATGNIFIADFSNHRIRKVNTAGNIQTVAGTGTLGFSGDGGPAASATLDHPTRVFVDGAGNLFIADFNNNRIRRVNTAGIIQTVAGNGMLGFSGDGGPATSAALGQPDGIFVDGAGNLFIAEPASSRICRVDTAGIIQTVAGGTFGFSGDGGAATSAALSFPDGVFVDGAGNLYIADFGNNRIRKVDTAGIIQTVAGNGTASVSGDGRAATSAALNQPLGVFVDGAGNIFIADANNNLVRKVDAATGIIQTVAGSGTAGFSGDGGPATSAALNRPEHVFVDGAGNLFIADSLNHRIRKVDTAGSIQTVAGNGTKDFSGDGGPATSAALNLPTGIFVDGTGNLFIADDENNRIRKVDTAGTIETVAGNGTQDFSGDGGPATSAALFFPAGVFVDGAGNLFIADSFNARIRMVDTAGNIQTVAGGGTPADFVGDGGPSGGAELVFPSGVFVDSAGDIFIADSGAQRVREVDHHALHIITTVAGNGTFGFSGDGGPATSAALNDPTGVALDGAGNIFIADFGNNRIRKVVVAEADLSAGSLTFAGQGVATASAPQTVTLSNPGSGPLGITSIAISGANGGDFTQSNNCGASVAGGTSCAITVTFMPAAAGSRTAAVTITTKAGAQSVALSGTGTDFAFALAAGGSNTATVSAGQTASYGLSLTATGAAQTLALSCTGAPAGATCTVPSAVTVTPGTTVPLNVSVSTTARNGPGGKKAGTPKGTYSLTVTATANGVSHSTQLTLTVQ